MAAAWVEYCNGSADSRWGRKRAERGHAAPYGVKLWSLGNELGYGHMEGPNAPADYVKRAKACARAMRKVDPSIQFLMSGLFAKEEWFTEGLSGLAGTVDYVSHHHYSRRLRSYAGDCATQDFFRVATAPGAALKELRRIREETDARSQAKRIGISFDEWNVWYAWYRHPGVVDGIHHASMLNMLCREAGKLGISMACFFEPVNEGAILVEPFRAYLPAGGQVFPMLKNHAGNTLLHLAPQDPAADLDATASLNRRTNRIVLTLVNRSPVAGQKVAVVLRNANPATVDGSLLAAPNYLPGTDFTEGTLPVKHRNNELGVVLPKHSVALLTVQLKEHPTQPKAGRTRAPSRRPKGRG